MNALAAHSVGLWAPVNQYIANILAMDIPVEDMVKTLRNAAGKEKKNEPTSLSNIRAAANQLSRGELISIL
jgi:hypothetical protein